MFENFINILLEKIIPFLIVNWEYSLGCLLVFLLLRRTTNKTRHQFNIWVASKHLAKLKNMNDVQQRFRFCRRINEYIFEEMVLTAFKKAGYKIRRSKRYSGDGGKDGEVYINGDWAFIQTKRYKGHIKKIHVISFRQLCEKKRVKGFFVHSGRTSKNTWKELGGNVQMVSGSRLINLLVNNKF
jgi:restriction system protein